MDTVAPQKCQKKVSQLRAAAADPQLTLPELTRPEQTAFPPSRDVDVPVTKDTDQLMRIWPIFLKHVEL